MKLDNYTAIDTKIHGMRKHLLTSEKIETHGDIRTLNELYALITENPSYKKAADVLKTVVSSREDIELMLNYGNFFEFLKLYRFASLQQRAFLKRYAMFFEAWFIKHTLRTVVNRGETTVIMSPVTHYLDDNRGFKTTDLIMATDVKTVVDALADTIYGPFFQQYSNLFSQNDYERYEFEIAFDQFVIQQIWQGGKKYLTGESLTGFKKLFGARFDILNIFTIYRLKFLYQLSDNEVTSALVDGKYRLNDEYIDRLLQAPDIRNFEITVAELGYGEIFEHLSTDESLQKYEEDFLRSLQRHLATRAPKSMYAIINYLEDSRRALLMLEELTERITYKNISPIERSLNQ
ncbi:V-type ATPase subunit [Aerococcus urinaeequi]|uniref:V-type ATPase subunit n=1 Tax=Aerococcus urinaeequi TaxID=51665 RepID=A0AA47G7J3_9LACT|nr:V-type ATPase subunit [Aerococcus urinaeequi]WAT23760.1 V-type ATPase subunit [Aerococcus urinaeequi]